MAVVTNLPQLQQDITQYLTAIYLALGLMGNIFNCVIFTRRYYHHTPSSVYFRALSIFGIIYLIWTSFPMIYTLNHPDPQSESVIYCKTQKYGTQCLALYLRYTVVFACIDRFLVTRTSVRLRSLSSVKTAIIQLIIMFIMAFFITIHMPINFDIRNGVCGTIGLYKLIFAIYQILAISIIPPVSMSIFSILTVRSLHQRHNAAQVNVRQRDRQLTRMIIAEVVTNVLMSIPFSGYLFYSALTYSVTNKSAERLEIEQFVFFIIQFQIYFLSVVPFYLFMLTSKPFRKEFVGLFVNFWYKFIRQRTQIVPFNAAGQAMNNLGQMVHDRQYGVGVDTSK